MDEIAVKKFYDEETGEGFVMEEEDVIRARREKLHTQEKKQCESKERPQTKAIKPDQTYKPTFDMFGLALSGGGIRSATFNLGFVKVLNEKSIFKYADYLSTVSGGGYTGGFIQKQLKKKPKL